MVEWMEGSFCPFDGTGYLVRFVGSFLFGFAVSWYGMEFNDVCRSKSKLKILAMSEDLGTFPSETVDCGSCTKIVIWVGGF